MLKPRRITKSEGIVHLISTAVFFYSFLNVIFIQRNMFHNFSFKNTKLTYIVFLIYRSSSPARNCCFYRRTYSKTDFGCMDSEYQYQFSHRFHIAISSHCRTFCVYVSVAYFSKCFDFVCICIVLRKKESAKENKGNKISIVNCVIFDTHSHSFSTIQYPSFLIYEYIGLDFKTSTF